MSDPPPLGRLENACLSCGYVLHGSDARVCSECGSARAVRLDFTTRRQYDLARLALRGMVLRSRDTTGEIIGILAGMSTRGGTLWIDGGRQAEALEALEDGGVHEIGPMLPIVDRSEPACPACDAALDPAGPALCPVCGAEFLWVRIDEPDVDTEGLLCTGCGYDLTGLPPGGVCPECGRPPPVDLEALVERALGPSEPAAAAASSPAPPPLEWRVHHAVWRLLLVLLVPIVVLLIVAACNAPSGPKAAALVAAAAAIVAAGVAVMWSMARGASDRG